MAGLTREGFTPSTHQEIVERISARLNAFSPGIDLSSESPDGQLVEIFSFELSQAWNELNLVYNSYNPNSAFGAGLRNIGLITGLPFGAATRSQTVVDLVGKAGTTIPRGSIASDNDGNEFVTAFAAVIPASVQVVAKVSGPINVDAGAITTIVSTIDGWDSVTNPASGRIGAPAQSEIQYRNLRNRTVLRNFVAVEDVIKARMLETLGIEQVVVTNNDSPTDTAPDGTPPNTIHVTVGEVGGHTTDEDIAQVIINTKGLGCSTFGSTSVTITDTQGNPKIIRFSKASPVPIFVRAEILFLDSDFAGAEESIKNDLVAHINALVTDEDVVWSRLFAVITPYSKAQVNSLEIGINGIDWTMANIPVGTDEFANAVLGQIELTVVN